MACRQVVDGGDGLQIMEDSCEYIECTVTDSQQVVVLQIGGGVGWGLTTPHRQKATCYEILYTTVNFDAFYGTTCATGHERQLDL
jgi:hypothetical protein